MIPMGNQRTHVTRTRHWAHLGAFGRIGQCVLTEAVGLRHLAAIYGWHRPTLRPQQVH